MELKREWARPDSGFYCGLEKISGKVSGTIDMDA
jgi:hypothetical protein